MGLVMVTERPILICKTRCDCATQQMEQPGDNTAHKKKVKNCSQCGYFCFAYYKCMNNATSLVDMQNRVTALGRNHAKTMKRRQREWLWTGASGDAWVSFMPSRSDLQLREPGGAEGTGAGHTHICLTLSFWRNTRFMLRRTKLWNW